MAIIRRATFVGVPAVDPIFGTPLYEVDRSEERRLGGLLNKARKDLRETNEKLETALALLDAEKGANARLTEQIRQLTQKLNEVSLWCNQEVEIGRRMADRLSDELKEDCRNPEHEHHRPENVYRHAADIENDLRCRLAYAKGKKIEFTREIIARATKEWPNCTGCGEKTSPDAKECRTCKTPYEDIVTDLKLRKFFAEHEGIDFIDAVMELHDSNDKIDHERAWRLFLKWPHCTKCGVRISPDAQRCGKCLAPRFKPDQALDASAPAADGEGRTKPEPNEP